jgi:membrane-associated phospholipid phosphatase
VSPEPPRSSEPPEPPPSPEPPAGADPAPPAGLSGPPPVPRPRSGVAAAVVLGLLAAAALWAALTGVGPARLDGAVLAEAVEDRTRWLTEAAIVLTNAGSTVSMAVLAVLVAIACWWRGRRADAVLAVGAMAGASLVFRLLKIIFDRQRPPVVDRLVPETNESLPSGHATMSIVVIGTIVVLAWAGRGVAGRVALVVAAALWVGAVGATRVYLGVHWVSDVLAGWLVGASWLALCVAVWAWWTRRGAADSVGTGATGSGTMHG